MSDLENTAQKVMFNPENAISPLPKNHEVNSIIEKVERFAELTDSLSDLESPDEVNELLADITRHGKWVFNYIEILERNAIELKEKAKRFTDAAKVQENKAKSYKEYLKTALRAGGFEKFKMDDLTLDLIKVVSYQPKSPATEKDLREHTEFVTTVFKWKTDPTVSDYVDYKEKIDRIFEWKLDRLKAEIKDCIKTINAKKVTPEERQTAQDRLDLLNELVLEQHSYQLRSSVTKV
jgi:hypothetical protein